MSTTQELLLARSKSDDLALLIGNGRWTYRHLFEEAGRRAMLFEDLRHKGRPPHVGILLDNVPDYIFWLTAGALSGTVIVGINSTYRGDQLGRLIRHTDCQIIVTSTKGEQLLEGVDTGVPDELIMTVDTPSYAETLAELEQPREWREISPDDLYLLIFTSGSTDLPKAVRCSHRRFSRNGSHVGQLAEIGPGQVIYSPLPLFHSAASFTGWATAVTTGATLSARERFSASATLPDVRRFGAVMLTYTGKVLNYILATPEQNDDVDNPLRLAIGNEASTRDIREFSRRFGCRVRDSYGSTEGMIIIRRGPSMPEGSLGLSEPTVKVIDPETQIECPPATFGPDHQVLNFEEAVGEIVETAPRSDFEGYYGNVQATNERFHHGWYWSGDLAYRDSDGWFYFAGRSNEWLRVDGENFAAAPLETIIGRFPDVRTLAVYAVPDDPVGDRVMVALEMTEGSEFDAGAFDTFLAGQPDMGTKWLPAFVRISYELPKLSSMKLNKRQLRQEAWEVDGVYWRPAGGDSLRPLTAADRAGLRPLLHTERSPN
jgi:fatty-acyl-CoA synthase